MRAKGKTKHHIVMKYLYYLSFIICAIILMLYLFGPYGGVSGLFLAMNEGFYGHDYIVSSFNISLSPLVLFLNRFVAFLFFGAIICCIASIFFRTRTDVKYRVGVLCLIIIVSIIFIPKLVVLLRNVLL